MAKLGTKTGESNSSLGAGTMAWSGAECKWALQRHRQMRKYRGRGANLKTGRRVQSETEGRSGRRWKAGQLRNEAGIREVRRLEQGKNFGDCLKVLAVKGKETVWHWVCVRLLVYVLCLCTIWGKGLSRGL